LSVESLLALVAALGLTYVLQPGELVSVVLRTNYMRVILAVKQLLKKVRVAVGDLAVQISPVSYQVVGVAMPIAVGVLVLVVAIVEQRLQEATLPVAVPEHLRLLVCSLVCAFQQLLDARHRAEQVHICRRALGQRVLAAGSQ
jgi:hypothetical protein